MKLAILLLVWALFVSTQLTLNGPQKKQTVSCKNEVFAALKPLPEIEYQCPADIPSDSDDRILKLPDRIKALQDVANTLESFSDTRWWAASVSDLNACYVRGQPGDLTEDETSQFKGVERQIPLLGNNRIRLVVIPDPCYQTSYNGANAFLLYREGPKVYVTKVLDGYFSRLDNSVFLHLFRSNADQAIEIETANISGMRPAYSSFFFVIDKVTHKAVRKKGLSRSRKA